MEAATAAQEEAREQAVVYDRARWKRQRREEGDHIVIQCALPPIVTS